MTKVSKAAQAIIDKQAKEIRKLKKQIRSLRLCLPTMWGSRAREAQREAEKRKWAKADKKYKAKMERVKTAKKKVAKKKAAKKS